MRERFGEPFQSAREGITVSGMFRPTNPMHHLRGIAP